MLRGLNHYTLSNDVDVLFPTKKGDYSEYNAGYREYLEINERTDKLEEIDENGYDSDDVQEYCQRLCEEYTEDDLLNMKYDKDVKYHKCVVTGSVGRWDGTHTIQPKEFDDAVDCLDSLIHTGYDHTYTLKRTGRWTFRFTESHHDDPMGNTHLKITIRH